MGIVRLRSVLCWFSSVAVLALHGCAVVTAPGFDFADPKLRSSITLGQTTPADPNAPPQGVITPITPALIQAQRASVRRDIPQEVQRLFAQPAPYTIGPSDIISIVVYDHPELQPQGSAVITQGGDPTGISGAPGFIVDDQGFIYYPYARRVKVGGLTEAQAAELIESRIRTVIKDPQVTVRIAAFRSRRAYVEGEVRNPGTQIFTDVPMTLSEAINRAGGITPTGDRSFVTLTRNDVTTTIDLMRLQDLGVNPSRILLQPGDLVTVRSREDNKVFVMGEITRPASLPMRNGRMTLNEAIAEVGGPNLGTANTGQIYVIRNVGQEAPALFHLNASSPSALALADNFFLLPRDVVYVDSVPLVQWNRIISLILPSAQAVSTGRSLVNP
ncbi:polysaccharide biosynthesis/export family protein [Ramlibacter sp. AN1133]|uniref:polysaccharide biosynthesis/export family protein n=1 Tax=Ramlibacter sp. AN1133 TaxID=3133429 RepID=UPI0040409709